MEILDELWKETYFFWSLYWTLFFMDDSFSALNPSFYCTWWRLRDWSLELLSRRLYCTRWNHLRFGSINWYIANFIWAVQSFYLNLLRNLCNKRLNVLIEVPEWTTSDIWTTNDIYSSSSNVYHSSLRVNDLEKFGFYGHFNDYSQEFREHIH